MLGLFLEKRVSLSDASHRHVLRVVGPVRGWRTGREPYRYQRAGGPLDGPEGGRRRDGGDDHGCAIVEAGGGERRERKGLGNVGKCGCVCWSVGVAFPR